MKELDDQFKLFTMTLKYPADGPDSIEGGKRIIDRKLRELQPPAKIPRKVQRDKNKYRL